MPAVSAAAATACPHSCCWTLPPPASAESRGTLHSALFQPISTACAHTQDNEAVQHVCHSSHVTAAGKSLLTLLVQTQHNVTVPAVHCLTTVSGNSYYSCGPDSEVSAEVGTNPASTVESFLQQLTELLQNEVAGEV